MPSLYVRLTLRALDVGGGWVPYKEPHALSRITLRWVVREATECSSILWEEDVLEKFRVRKPKEGTKEMQEYIEHEKHDALSDFHSAFSWANVWWILELLPLIIWWKVFGMHFRFVWCVISSTTIRTPDRP